MTTPITRRCSPFSIEVIEQTDSSILLGSCPLIRTEERVPTGPRLLTMLLDSFAIAFLAPDPGELLDSYEQWRTSELATEEARRTKDRERDAPGH